MELEEGDVVLCTVEKVIGTNVFVRIEGKGEGSIITSEIAAGRIRNIRDYVVPKKKIVCKILRISMNRIDLSLRRVTQKEHKQVMEEYKLERGYMNILKTILKEKSNQIIQKITERDRLYDFIEEVKENPSKLKEIVGKEDAKKILDIINTQKQKRFIIKKEILLNTTKPNGLELIKEILGEIKTAEIRYISAGHYSLKTESSGLKEADHNLKKILSEIEKESKKKGFEFTIIEK